MEREIDEKSLEEVAYSIIEKFIQSAEMSNRSFALTAGFLNPQTFQNMLYRRSRISMTNYIRIAGAMKNIVMKSGREIGECGVELRQDLMYLMTIFGSLTPNIDPDRLKIIKKRLRCFPVPIKERFSSEIWGWSGENDGIEDIEEIKNMPETKMLGDELVNNFYLLNRKGQEKVIEYAQDLGENPRYQKKDGE